MSIFKDIQNSISQAENLIEELANELKEITQTLAEMDQGGAGTRLGLAPHRGNNKQPARKGDIVLRVETNGTLVPFVISDISGDKPLAKNSKRNEEIGIEPELLLLGTTTENPQFKAVAAKMAAKYPKRRVYLYGDTKIKKGPGAGLGTDRNQKIQRGKM